jgi:hypothetical protein
VKDNRAMVLSSTQELVSAANVSPVPKPVSRQLLKFTCTDSCDSVKPNGFLCA